MKIRCEDIRRARKNLESASRLGKQSAGLFGYIKIKNEKGGLYIYYRSNNGVRAIADRRKIEFWEDHIVLKYDHSKIYFLTECLIILSVLAAEMIFAGEIIYNVFHAHKVNAVDAAFLWYLFCAMLWFLWAAKIGPSFYMRNFVKAKIKK